MQKNTHFFSVTFPKKIIIFTGVKAEAFREIINEECRGALNEGRKHWCHIGLKSNGCLNVMKYDWNIINDH